MGSSVCLADPEGRRGRRRGQDHVAVRERLVEIPLDQRPDLGCLLVVGVVVTRREGVGADHDPPLHLGAEARGAGFLVHLQQIAALSGAEAVLHAVVAGEVGARLRRGDDVVDGQTVLACGEARPRCTSPPPPRRPGSPRRTAASTSGSIPAIKYSFGMPDCPSLDPLAQELPVIGDLLRHRGRFPRVVAGDDVHQDGAVLHILREGADLVQRRGKGDQAEAGDPAVGRLHPDDAAEGRRLADGAARVGTERGDAFVGRHRRRGAAARPAGDPLEIPGVPGHAEEGGLRGGTHRELVHVRLAGEDGARRPELLHDGRVVGGDEVLEDPGAAGRPDPLRAEDVLQGDGDSRQRADLAFSDRLVRRVPPRPGPFPASA